MIRARAGVAVCLLISLAALALSVVAFAAAFSDDPGDRGRQVQTRIDARFDGEPVSFPLDEFYVARGENGRLRAVYVYPPGFFGHTRGCKVVWGAAEPAPDGTLGLFVDPCGGARYRRDGALLSGPGERGLDWFATAPGVEGMIVDTRTLYCGDPPGEQPTPRADTPTTQPPAPPQPGAPPQFTPTASPTATQTQTPTPSATPTPGKRKTCDRVSPDER